MGRALSPLMEPRVALPAGLGSRYGILAVLSLIILANIVLTPNFATFRNIEITLIQLVFVLLVGTGMTLVIASGGIDLSVGAVMGLVSVVAYELLPWGPAAVIPACLVAGLSVGALNGALVALLNVQPLLITLGSLIWVRGLAQTLSDGRKEYFQDAAMKFLGLGRIGGMPLQVVVTLLIVAIMAFIVARTVYGRRLVATGGNRNAARLAGIPIAGTLVATYAICGMLAGLAGLFITARVGSSDPTNFGLLIELDAIAAVVVGGTPLSGGRARVLGTVIGAFLLQLVTAGMIMNNISFQVALLVKALIILVAVYLQGARSR